MRFAEIAGSGGLIGAVLVSVSFGLVFSEPSKAGGDSRKTEAKSASTKALPTKGAPANGAPANGAPNRGKIVNDPAFGKALLAVAAEYKSYGKVDDLARWAPWLCAAPPPPKARLSSSSDPSTHGRKVYFVYAKNRDQYFKKEPPQPGQVVVKESWYPVCGANGEIKLAVRETGYPKEESDYKPAAQASDKQGDLFIMIKLKADTPNTDNGWVYGTVTADGKTVTSAGRNESCMGCHIPAPNDRLFGLAQ